MNGPGESHFVAHRARIRAVVSQRLLQVGPPHIGAGSLRARQKSNKAIPSASPAKLDSDARLPHEAWINGMAVDTDRADSRALPVLRIDQDVPCCRHYHRWDSEQCGPAGAQPFAAGTLRKGHHVLTGKVRWAA